MTGVSADASAKLPMTVVAGYLGAGKTTLINRLLAEDHGLRLLVMVNDFGAINIDADLLESRDEDTLTLTNGCACCTMGADLFMAMGDALDRRPRPDHLVIEASGVADPKRIADAGIAESEMTYGGIVTVVDGVEFPRLAEDGLIGPQVRAQAAQADLLHVSKVDPTPDALLALLAEISGASVLDSGAGDPLSPLLFAIPANPRRSAVAAVHPDYVSYSYEGPVAMTRGEIGSLIARRPQGLFRAKGRIAEEGGASWEVQVVGTQVSITRGPAIAVTRFVGIGLASNVTRGEIEDWWKAALPVPHPA